MLAVSNESICAIGGTRPKIKMSPTMIFLGLILAEKWLILTSKLLRNLKRPDTETAKDDGKYSIS